MTNLQCEFSWYEKQNEGSHKNSFETRCILRHLGQITFLFDLNFKSLIRTLAGKFLAGLNILIVLRRLPVEK